VPSVIHVRYLDFTTAQKLLETGKIDALIDIPPDFGSNSYVKNYVLKNFKSQVESALSTVIVSPSIGSNNSIGVEASSKSPLGQLVGEGIAAAIESRIYTGILIATTIEKTGSSKILPPFSELISQGANAVPAFYIKNSPLGSSNNIIGYYSPSMAIIFLFIIAGLGSRSITVERTTGTISRLSAAPVGSRGIVFGKVGAIVFTGLLSILFLWGETSLLFHSSWGNDPGVLIMCIATVMAMGGLSLFLTSLAKDDKQALTASVLVGFLLGFLSGNFFPPGSLPPIMQDLSLAVPNGWALVGFGRLAQEHYSWQGIIQPAIILALIGSVFGIAAMFRINKLVRL
jgi:ABC-type multidrug transport system permease subunit